jgi:inner membrane protein
MFVLASHLANRQVTTLVSAQFPDATQVDKVLSPLPVNPLCWKIILVQLEGDDYTLREAMFSLAPGWLPAAQCAGFALDVTTTATLTPVAAVDSSSLAWHGEVTMSLAEMQMLVQDNCEAAAFTRFARALWITRADTSWLLGDLRYDREPGLGFAELALPAAPQQCPRNIPPWTPPRSDVLGQVLDSD